MAAADRQYSINFKAKVLREWRLYASRKALNSKKLRFARAELFHRKKRRLSWLPRPLGRLNSCKRTRFEGSTCYGGGSRGSELIK